ncbi:MAG: flagellar hook-basal body complex protein, partial [Alphaproteobacteria bacterium]
RAMVAGTASPMSFASGGVRATPTRNVEEQGLLKATGSSTDVAVSGKGLIVVKRLATTATGQANEAGFIRTGSFMPDENGDLYDTASGWYLQGWPTDGTGNKQVTDANSIQQLQTVRLNQITGISAPTSSMQMRLNLPEADAIGAVQNTSLTFYDSLGVPHAMDFQWTKIAAIPPTWDLDVTVNGGGGTVWKDAGFVTPYTGMRVVFDGNGNPVSFDGANNPPNMHINWTNAASNSDVELDLGIVGSTNAISARQGIFAETKLDQNGKGIGQPSGIEITDDGFVSALFSNGLKLKIAKIPLATLTSPHNCSFKDGGIFQVNDLTGEPLLSDAKSAGTGAIYSNSIEESTVKQADQFIKMMELGHMNSGAIKVIETENRIFRQLEEMSG